MKSTPGKQDEAVDAVDVDGVDVVASDDDRVAILPDGAAADFAAERRVGGCRRGRSALLGAAALVVVAVVCAILILRPTSSTKSLRVPETFSGSFVSGHRYEHKYRCEGTVSKSQGADGRSVVEAEVSYTDEDTGNKITLTLLNRRAYRVMYGPDGTTAIDTMCQPSHLVPPLGDVGELLNRGVSVRSEDIDDTNPGYEPCRGAASRYVLLWGEQEFVYCPLEDGAHSVASDTFGATFVPHSPARASLGLTVPTDLATGKPLECPEIVDRSALDVGEVTIDAPVTSRRLGRRRSGEVPIVKRRCTFVHGLRSGTNAAHTADDADYWGSVMRPRMERFCSEFRFVRQDMLDSAWTVEAHGQAFCNAVADGYNTGSGAPVAQSALVFSHGSGSLVVARALARGLCDMDSNSRWYSASAPFEGSKAAANWPTVCASSAGATIGDGYCPANADTTYNAAPLGVRSMAEATAGLTTMAADIAEALVTARARVSGALCGYRPRGLNHVKAAELVTVADEVYPHDWSDGITKFSSCKAVGADKTWDTRANKRWSKQAINYFDGKASTVGACLDPTAERSPARWYMRRAKAATTGGY